MPLIRQDSISIGLTIVAVSLFFFLSTFGTDITIRSMFALSLALAGLVLSRLVKQHEEDADIEGGEWREIFRWVVVSLMVIVGLNLVVPKIPFDIGQAENQLSATELIIVPRMFGILIAVAEEQFFRGFFANFAVSRVGVFAGSLMSGGFFGVYHLAVYGSSLNTMMFVVGAGIILTYVAIRTRRVSVSMLGHVINNAWAGA